MLIQHIPTDSIILSPYHLRRQYYAGEEFTTMFQSIKKIGIVHALIVTPIDDNKYSLLDGYTRWRIAHMLALPDVPAIVYHLTDLQQIEFSMLESAKRIACKPEEYIKALLRVLDQRDYTLIELAQKICREPDWIMNQLGLNKLHKNIRTLIREGTLHLYNAYLLSKLKRSVIKDFVQHAIDDTPDKFKIRVKNEI